MQIQTQDVVVVLVVESLRLLGAVEHDAERRHVVDNFVFLRVEEVVAAVVGAVAVRVEAEEQIVILC